jgi:hypothetical protein
MLSPVVGRLQRYHKRGESRVAETIGDSRMGRGRQPTLDGWEGKGNQKSKVEKEEQFHE